jgi:hypothetical protein
VQLFSDYAIINQRTYKTIRVRSPKHPEVEYRLNGMYFETEEEFLFANMLTAMEIPFLHHVQFVFPYPEAPSGEVIWCPDFILGGTYRWIGSKPCNSSVVDGSLIVGIEIKRQVKREIFAKKSFALLTARSIPIIIVSRAHIIPYIELGRLPLEPIAQSAA